MQHSHIVDLSVDSLHPHIDLVEHVAFCDLPMCKWAVNEVKVEASALSMER